MMFRKIAFTTVLVLPLLLSASSAFGQASTGQTPAAQPDHKRFYRLEFTVKQVEAGRTINSRKYSTVLQEGGLRSSIRSGAKVPFKNGSAEEQLDVGLNIDCLNPVEVDGQLDIHIKAELSSVADNSDLHSGEPPILRQNMWESEVTVPLRKGTTIFASDDLASKQTVQLEVLAMPLK